MFFVNLIIGLLISILLVLCLTKRNISNFIVGIIAGGVGSFVGPLILNTHNDIISNLVTSFLGSLCLSILFLYIQKLILNTNM